jgi:hypothetical protein
MYLSQFCGGSRNAHRNFVMSSPQSLASPSISKIDFVTGDFDALASHMQHCARAQSRWFALQDNMQRARSLAAGRIVTMACVAIVLAIGLFAVA